MDFATRLIRGQPIEIEQISTNLKSETELSLWTTPEDLPESAKASLLIESGFPLQKIWVMQNMHLFPTSTSLLTQIFVTITKQNIINWPEELQLECGTGLLLVISKDLLQDSLKLECVQLSLTFLSFYSRTLHSKWLPVYTSLLPQIPVNTIKQKLVPEIMLLSDCSQKAITREVSVKLLEKLAEVLGKEFKGPLLQRAKALSQDTCPEVRVEMARTWTVIIKVLGRSLYEETIFFDVLKLIEDESLEVRAQGVRVLISSLDMVSETFFLKEVSQIIRPLFSGFPETVEKVICENLGILAGGCYGLYKNDIVSLMKRFSKIDVFKKPLAFNYPGLVTIIGLNNEVKEIGVSLSEDSNSEVVKTFAKGFHEVLGMNTHCKILKKIANRLLEDSEARVVVFKKLPKWCQVYDSSSLLIKFIKFLTLPVDWRTQTDLFRIFIEAIPLFSLKEILDHFIPLILHKMLTACSPVKSAACQALSKILIQTYYISRKLDICNIVKEKLARSLSSYDRVLFIEFCEIIIEMTSRKFFAKHFLQDFLNMGFDKSSAVLMKYLTACYKVAVFGYNYNILDILDQVKATGSCQEILRELSEYLKSAEIEILISENLAKDKEKENSELQLEKMEVKEVENSKKRAADEMALKATETSTKGKKVVIKGRIQSESIDPKGRNNRSTALIKPQPVKKK